MNVLLFGATGMVGQGVLRECLLDPNVQLVQTVGRTPLGVQHPKLREIVHQDLWHFEAIESNLSGLEVCFFCLGVSSSGMTEQEYEPVTYGITLAAAETLARLDPQMTFIYVSGAGTDSSEQGQTMWVRISKEKRRMRSSACHLQQLTCSARASFSPFTEPGRKPPSFDSFTRSAHHCSLCSAWHFPITS